MEELDQPPPTKDECTIAMLAHLLQLFTGFIGPLALLVVKRDSRFVVFHALQALLLQIALVILGLFTVLTWFGFFIYVAATQWTPKQGAGRVPVVAILILGLFILLWMAAWAIDLLAAIIFGIKAHRGEWAEYPLIGKYARRLAGIPNSRKSMPSPP